MKRFACIYTMIDIERSNAERPVHVAYLRSLLDAGKIETGWKFPHYEAGALQGMLVCNAETKEEVEEWFRKDPVIVCGARTFEVREALPMSLG